MDQLKLELQKLGLSTEGTKTQLVVRYIEGMKTDEDLQKEALK